MARTGELDVKIQRVIFEHQGGRLVIERTNLDRKELIPTATATDAKASGVTGNWTKEKAAATSGRHSGTTLTDYAVRAGSDGQRSSGGMRLSPRFVEWMMALPDGWAKIDGDPSEWADQIHALGNSVVDVGAAFGFGVLLTRLSDDDPGNDSR